ncbi:hypothetical protein TrST_g1924 [Triparma strigata]|uniref:Transmembrane protein n=1 Tax=Triparma strigata TaxID=1606541 RepID=A0A9W7AKD6_9STRA|nr:hypothetical protein TrST_g1924 [Triparma strigata]
MSSPLHEAAETEMTEMKSNPLHLPLFKGSFKPSASLIFFKTSLTRLGRVRKATDQEGDSEREKEARVARPLVWMLVTMEFGFFVLTAVCASSVMDVDDGDSEDKSSRSVFEKLDTNELRSYISLAAIPFMRLFSFCIILANSSLEFSLPESVAIGLLCVGNFIRLIFKSTKEGDVDRTDVINPRARKVIAFIADVVFFLLFAYVRRRVSNELSHKEKENFVYNLLPTTLVGTFVPLAYLISETFSCWGNFQSYNFTEICHDKFVCNDAMANGFLGAGFLYLVLKPFYLKSMTMVNIVGFNFPCFRTYAQVIVFGLASFWALFLFSTSNEIAANTFVPGDRDKNIEYYFEDDSSRTTDFLYLSLTLAQWKFVASSFINLTFFLLIISAAFPMPDKKQKQQAGEETTDESAARQEENRFKLSRYLRSKLKTLRPYELAPFYRYAALVGLFVTCRLLALEVIHRRTMFQRSWEVLNYYRDECEHMDSNQEIHCKDGDEFVTNSRDEPYSNYLCQSDLDPTKPHEPYFTCGELWTEENCGTKLDGFAVDEQSGEIEFYFSRTKLKLEDFLRVSENIQGCDDICRFCLMGLLHFTAMIVFGFRPRDAEPSNGQFALSSFLYNEFSAVALNFFAPFVPVLWLLLTLLYYTKLGHDEIIEATVGEEHEDITITCSYRLWTWFNTNTNWILVKLRVPAGEMRLSPFLQWIFALIGICTAVPFLLARIFQYFDAKLSITLWSISLRLSGDLFIPVMVLYLTVFQFSDLSTKGVKWKAPLTLIILLYIVDAASFYQQKPGFQQKSARTEDEDGDSWFARQVVICTSVVLLLVLIVVQKRRCYRLRVNEKRIHLFENVAYVALSTFPTLTYLISEYFACATRVISKNFSDLEKLQNDKETSQEDVVIGFIEDNKCEGILYGIMPLVLMLVFSAVARVAYPQGSDDLKMKNIMTLKLSPFRLVQLVIISLQSLVAVVFFGVRVEAEVDSGIETACTYYFIFTLLFFIAEGFYTSFLIRKKRGRGNDEFDVSFNEDDQPTIRIRHQSMEDRKNVGSEVSIWDGGTGGRFKPLEKDRTKRGLGNNAGEDLMMGAGIMGETNMAPGML